MPLNCLIFQKDIAKINGDLDQLREGAIWETNKQYIKEMVTSLSKTKDICDDETRPPLRKCMTDLDYATQ